MVGGTDGTSELSGAEIYDVKTDTWAAAGAMTQPRAGHTATMLPWGSVLIVGGRSNGAVSDSVEAYWPVSGEFRTIGKLSSARTDYAIAVLSNKRVVIAGGSDGNAALNSIDVYDAATNKLTAGGTMLVARKNFAASALLDGRVLISGGYGSDGRVLASSEIFDTDSGASSDGPQLTVSRAGHQSMTLPNNGRVLLIGGTDGRGDLSITDTFEPWTGKMVRTGDMNTPRSGQTSNVVRRGALIVAGGKNGGKYQSDSELYGFATIATDQDDYKPGQIATFTGTGWKPGEQVRINVSAFPLDDHKVEFTATAAADGAGQLRLSGFNIDQSHLGARFMLTAIGSESQAQALFTDGNATSIIFPQFAPLSGTSPYGTAVTLDGFVSNGSNPCTISGGFATITVDGIVFSNAVPVSAQNVNACPSATPLRNNGTNGYFTFTFSGGQFLPPGTHTVGISYNGNGPDDPSPTTSLSYNVQSVTVTVGNPTYGGASITYGQTTSICSTVTNSPATGYTGNPNGSLNFNAPGPINVLANVIQPGVPSAGSTTFCGTTPVNLGAGTYNFSAQYTPGTDAFAGGVSGPSPLTVSAATVIPALTLSPSGTVGFGTSVLMSAHVSTASGAVPVGTVTFNDNVSGALGTVPVDGAGNASLSVSTLAVGNHILSITFNPGNANFATATGGNQPLTVSSVITTTTIAPSSDTQTYGHLESWIVTVSCSAPCGAPAGNVKLIDTNHGNAQIGAITALTPAGANSSTATISSNSLIGGTHNLTAQYTHTTGSGFVDSNGTGSYTVNKVAATVSQTMSPSTSLTVGQTATVNVTVTGQTGLAVPTGSINWSVVGGSPASGTVTLNNGTASFTFVAATNPTPSVTSTYVPDPTDPNYLTANNNLPFTVGLATTSTALTTNPTSPVQYGTAVLLTAAISPTLPGGPVLTGTVNFRDGGITIAGCGAQPIVSGVATCSVAATTFVAATHSLTAVYSGDTNYATSTSNAVSFLVNQATTTTTITNNAPGGVINHGGTVTFNISVSLSPALAGNPPNSVTLTDNGTPFPGVSTCSAVTLTASNPATGSCTATYNGTGPLTGGGHTVVATEAGNANIAGSSGSTTLTVNKAVTTAAINPASPASPIWKQSTILSATFTHGTGSTNLSGGVNFFDGATLLNASPVAVVDGSPTTFTVAGGFTVGNHTITAQFVGPDTNNSNATTPALLLTVVKDTSTTVLSGVSNIIYGQTETFTATVTDSLGTTPVTGTVDFKNASTLLGSCTLGPVSGGAACTFTTSTLDVASYGTVTATYNGDSNVTGSTSAPASITVSKANTTTTLASSAINSPSGASVTITATVAPQFTGVPTGNVTFTDITVGAPLGTVATTAGKASISTSSLTPGTHVIQADFVATGSPVNFNNSSTNPGANLNQVILKGNLTVAVTSGLSPSNLGQAVTLTATMTPVAGALGTPNGGTMRFFDGGSPIGTATVTNSFTASITFTFNTGGNHPITANYDASTPAVDPNFNSSALSPAFTQVVNAAGTTVVLTTTPVAGTGSVYGQNVTFSAAVTVNSPGSGTPTGSVQFQDGNTVFGSCTLASGSCSTTYGLLSVTTHNLTAKYLGDTAGQFGASTSTPVSFTVGKNTINIQTVVATATTAPTTSPFNLGQNIVFTETPTIGTAQVPGATPPGGTVTFLDSSTSIGTGALSGSASLTINTLAAGSHPITASYGGDPNYASAPAGGSTTISINQATPGVTASAAPNPDNYGTPYTLSATVTGVGVFPPNGTVTFSTELGAVTCGVSYTVTGNTGTATCSPAAGTIPVGAHNLTATFTPDPAIPVNYTSKTSVAVPFTINNATINFVITSSVNPSIPGQPVTFTATALVGAGAITPITGTVVFFADGSATPICASPSTLITSLGVTSASCTATGGFALGSHVITISYNPGANQQQGTVSPVGGLVQQVNQAAVDFAFLANPNPSNYGQMVNVTVTLTPHAPAVGTPTGSVTLYDGGVAISAAHTLAGGVVLFKVGPGGDAGSTNPLSVGTHTLSAIYSGDSNFSANQDSQVAQLPSARNIIETVSTATPTIDMPSFSPGNQVYGAPVTISTVVHPPFTGAPIPTGIVTFWDGTVGGGGSKVLGTGTLDGTGTATLTLNTLTVGSPHGNIFAAYGGNATYSAVNSAAGSVTITKAPTTVVVNPINPAVAGQQITLTAQVTVNAPSTINPGSGAGMIAFYDGTTATLLDSAVINGSGIASIQVTMTNPKLLNPVIGNHSIIAIFTDTTGNYQNSPQSAAQILAVAQSTTTTNVTSSANPSVYGQAIVFTATVQAISPGAGTPTGTVTFFSGGAQIGTPVTVSGTTIASASITVPTGSTIPALAVGDHIITAKYNGDTSFAVSNSPSTLVQTVNKANTVTLLTPSTNSSVVGQQVVLTATVTVVSPGSGVPTGTVNFFNGGTSLGSGNLVATTAGGSTTYDATITIPATPGGTPLPQGNLALTAVYVGDNNFLGSTSTIVTQAVSKPGVTIVVTTTLSPSILGTQTTFQATVAPIPPGVGVPTGTVQFFDGSNLLATVQLVGGGASYTTSLPVGSHAISAAYSGDANYQANVSPTIPQIVNKIPASASIASSSINAVASQPITFTAQIGPTPPPGIPSPSGQVVFLDGGIQIGVGDLAGGVASFTTTTLIAGNHLISAAYAGDNNYTGATSVIMPQVVSVAQTNTTIVASVNPSVYGQPVTFTIGVSVGFPGTIAANGFVQLYDNNNALGDPLVANNGTFTITIPGFTPGTHNIYADFRQNGSFSGSRSAVLTQIVNKAPTVTTLAATPFSSTSGQGVQLTAVVQVPTPGAGIPTGTVQFVNTTTATVLGSAPLTLMGGILTATINTSQLTQGGAPQVLTATYSGDTNFATSTSNPVGQSVFGTQLAVVGAASYTNSNFAPDEIASAFGTGMADTTLSADVTPLPSALANTTVTVTDSAGVSRLAPLFFVSPGQINFLIPTSTAFGLANVKVTNPEGATFSTIILVTHTAPGIFSANASGKGIAAAAITRVHSDGSQALENVATFDSASGKSVAIPIDMSNATDQLFVVLYGTGIRYNPALNSVKATINGINVPVLYAGAQPAFVGLDQVNLGPLPASLKGAGEVNVVITVDNQAANTVTLTFK